MTYSIEQWRTRAEQGQAWADQARHDAVRNRRLDRYAYLIAILIVLIIGAVTYIGLH